MRQVLYINGVKRNTNLDLETGGRFFADSDNHPFLQCSQHYLDMESVRKLQYGFGILTSGNSYSLSPDRDCHGEPIIQP